MPCGVPVLRLPVRKKEGKAREFSGASHDMWHISLNIRLGFYKHNPFADSL